MSDVKAFVIAVVFACYQHHLTAAFFTTAACAFVEQTQVVIAVVADVILPVQTGYSGFLFAVIATHGVFLS